jgi:hypothetical protein
MISFTSNPSRAPKRAGWHNREIFLMDVIYALHCMEEKSLGQGKKKKKKELESNLRALTRHKVSTLAPSWESNLL